MSSSWKNRDTGRVKPKNHPYKREKSINLTQREVIREDLEKKKNTLEQQEEISILNEDLLSPPLSYFDEILEKLDKETDNNDDTLL